MKTKGKYTIKTDGEMMDDIEATCASAAVEIFTDGKYTSVREFFDSIPVEDGGFAWIDCPSGQRLQVGQTH